jgi:hypothetical protein
MEYLIGLFLSLAVAGLAIIIGLDQERAFYPAVLIVIASYYVLFAVMAASGRTLVIEIAVASGFLLLAIIGYKKSLWLVASALAGHGVFDIVHHLAIENPGVPHWWPGFCLVFDVDSRRFIGRALVEEQAGNSLASATMLSRHSQLALNPVALEKLFSAEFSKRDCARSKRSE